jgi:long-chain fatty acid transport protein
MSRSVPLPKASLRLVIACVLGLWVDHAEASPLFDLTGDTQGMGGLQARVVPGGSAAAYFNPALLTDSPTCLHAGFMLLSQQISMSLDARPGPQYDVPRAVVRGTRGQAADYGPFSKPFPTQDLEFGREADMVMPAFKARPRQAAGTGHETITYLGFGIVGQLFDDHLALGIHGFVPIGDFTRVVAFYNDEREQYFSNSLHPEMYGDRMTAPSLAFGAGVRLIEGLSLGIGATLNLKANAVAPAYVSDTGNLANVLIDMDTSVNVSLTPHFGVAYTLPGERLRLTAVAHPPRQMEFATGFGFGLPSGLEQSSAIPFVLNYTPWQFGVGAAFDIVHGEGQAFTAVASLQYATWSTYIDRHGDKPTPAYAFSDILSPVLGFRYRAGSISALADASYVPTPVPPQTGRTNYVDNDRISTSLGGEIGFGVFGTEAQVGLQLQAHRLLPRRQAKLFTPTSADGENQAPELVKDEVPDDALAGRDPLPGAQGLQTNNPGWPGFGSEGWVFVGGLYVRVSL